MRSLAPLLILLLSGAALAQEEPPPPLLDEWIGDEAPAEDAPPAEPPPAEEADAPPPVERAERPLPPADPLPPQTPFWERNPLVGTVAAGVGGGLAAAVAVGATWGLFIGFESLNSNASILFASTTLLLGVTAIPFIAGFGAGAALLPLSPDCSGAQLGELCESCMLGWACVGCAFGGGGGVNCSAPMNNLFGGGGGPLANRSEVYWAAIGAGAGTIAGGGAAFLITLDNPGDFNTLLLTVSAGAVLGATLGGLGGGGIGTLVNGWGFEEGPQRTGRGVTQPVYR